MAIKSKNVERVIFSTYHDEQLFTQCKNELAETLAVPVEDVDNERVWDMYNSYTNEDLRDFQAVLVELVKKCTYNEHHFALVGKAQTWRGTWGTCKHINLKDLLTSCGRDIELIKIYTQGKRVYIQAAHHDGVHHFEIRQKRDNVWSHVFDESFDGGVECVLNRTKTCYPLFAKYYGW